MSVLELATFCLQICSAAVISKESIEFLLLARCVVHRGICMPWWFFAAFEALYYYFLGIIIDQFRYIKILLDTIDLRLDYQPRGGNRT